MEDFLLYILVFLLFISPQLSIYTILVFQKRQELRKKFKDASNHLYCIDCISPIHNYDSEWELIELLEKEIDKGKTSDSFTLLGVLALYYIENGLATNYWEYRACLIERVYIKALSNKISYYSFENQINNLLYARALNCRTSEDGHFYIKTFDNYPESYKLFKKSKTIGEMIPNCKKKVWKRLVEITRKEKMNYFLTIPKWWGLEPIFETDNSNTK